MKDEFVIAQFSDVHCGDPRFDEKLMMAVVGGINELAPDLVVVPGDLTAEGYREEFEQFARFLEMIECRDRIVIAGNHDCRNVGYGIFEEVIGPRNHTAAFPFGVRDDPDRDTIRILAVDSNIPDLNDGEVGREKTRMVREELGGAGFFKVFVLHHHLVGIPVTGRERNVVWDAGDILQALRDVGADLVIAGHKHVPYVWPLAGMLIATSGTAASWRTRGDVAPSYTVIRIGCSEVSITLRPSAGGGGTTETHPRRGSGAKAQPS